jgi:hypothetical protein
LLSVEQDDRADLGPRVEADAAGEAQHLATTSASLACSSGPIAAKASVTRPDQITFVRLTPLICG